MKNLIEAIRSLMFDNRILCEMQAWNTQAHRLPVPLCETETTRAFFYDAEPDSRKSQVVLYAKGLRT